MSSNFSWVKKSEAMEINEIEQSVSGIGVKKTEEIDSSVINNTIASINAGNNYEEKPNTNDLKRQEIIEEEKQKRRENYFKDRARKEKIAKIQREEEARKIREAEAEKLHNLAERNPLFKVFELGQNAIKNITDNSNKTAFGNDNLKENKQSKVKDTVSQLKNKELFKSQEEKEEDEYNNSNETEIISLNDNPINIKRRKQKEEKQEKKLSFFEELGKKFIKKTKEEQADTSDENNEDNKEIEESPDTVNTSNLNVNDINNSDDTQYSIPSTEADWQYLATHDDMTGLMNIRAFMEKVSQNNVNLGIAIIDVDGLNEVNNALGRKYGDKFIRAVANAIDEIFNGCCYRIGGDEFAIVLEGRPDYQETRFFEGSTTLNERFRILTENDNPEGIIYSASFGYAIPHDNLSFQELQSEAEQMMQKDKEAYKMSHPIFTPKKIVEKEEQPENYDELLSFEQRELKSQIQQIHMPAMKKDTANIMRKIQAKSSANEVVGVIMASHTFDYLAIFNDGNAFISMVQDEMQNEVDYSYLYVIYEGGPMYYGTDDYLSQVTHIFEGIATLLVEKNDSFTDEEIRKIPKINIFKQIFISRE